MTNPRLRYQTVEFGKIDIHVCTLRDKQEFFDPHRVAENLGISSAFWSLFGVIWPSSVVLAHYVFEHDAGSKRILEVGCGMALASLLLNKQDADITATDYHPETETFLKRNALLNQDRVIPYEQTDWADNNDALGQFDLIIGSDLMYEDQHVELLANFIQEHANLHCEVIVVDPGRGRKNKLRAKMLAFGFSSIYLEPENTDYLEKDFKGLIMKFDR